MSKKGTGKLVLGASLGAGLALLFAPKKGSELREDLIATADRLDTAMIKTKEFINKLDNFASVQREINNGRW